MSQISATKLSLVALISASALATTAPVFAAEIPVSIGWEGVKPDRVSVQGDTGINDFDYDPASQKFTSNFTLAANEIEVRTLIVTYGGRSIPLFLKVNAFLPSISFRLSVDQHDSCTGRMATEVEKLADNVPDALRAVLTSARLLAIPSPNDCATLKPRIVEARYKRTVQLAQLSKGLFQTDSKLRAMYVESVPMAQRGTALAKVAAYEEQITGLEAVQLTEQRTVAQKEGDFTTAAAINDVMVERTAADPKLRDAYAAEGLTARRLEKDGAFLNARAIQDRGPQ